MGSLLADNIESFDKSEFMITKSTKLSHTSINIRVLPFKDINHSSEYWSLFIEGKFT